MKIKEVEESVSITSKNIRFYEKEGLIAPRRDSENGYREYSVEDIKLLKEIKLYRKLGISIEDIRLLQRNEITFKAVLSKQITNYTNELNNLNQVKELCINMEKENVELKEVDADLWLDKMLELESGGTRFMSISNDEIIRFLPDKFKMKYYESIIKNGQIDNTLLCEIVSYFEDTYKKSVDAERLLVDILKSVDLEERSKLLKLVEDNNQGLYEKLSRDIYAFEDIINIDNAKVKGVLEQFNVQFIVKASKGASPMVNEYLKNLFPKIDFDKERQAIGIIPISEIINIHEEIIGAINKV